MSYRNYLKIGTEEKEKEIYRVMPGYRLLEIFKKKKNTLSKPHLWGDPYENFILKGRGRFSNGTLALIGMRDSIYGQCWTINIESDAMWRIYSPDKNGVKVRTTIKKLFESLYKAISPRTRDVKCFIGKVEYYKKEEEENLLKKIYITDSTGAGIAETLLFKRRAFSHEKEVRLIYTADKDKAQPEIFQYNINPYELIEQIVFDPRMNEYLYQLYKESLRKMNFKGRIMKSGLYRPPEKIIVQI